MNKKILLSSIVAFLVASLRLIAQENVGIGTVHPDNSAIVEINSVDKGLLVPRMTLNQRNNIETTG